MAASYYRIIYVVFGRIGLPQEKSWTLAGGILQHFNASQFIQLIGILLRAEGSLPLFRQMSAINTRHAHMTSNSRYVRRASWFVRPNLSSVNRMLTARAVLSPVLGMFELHPVCLQSRERAA